MVLGDLASRLEAELKGADCLCDPSRDLARLADLIEVGSAALMQIITSFAPAAATPKRAPEFDDAAFETMLGEIDVLLAAANMRAVSACAELARSMDAAGVRRLAHLLEAIDRLNLAQARVEVTRLIPAFDRLL